MWGTKEDCKKFKVEIKLKDKKGKSAITVCDHPLSVDISKEELLVEGVQVSNVLMKRNICTPMVDNLEQVSLPVIITFAAVEDKQKIHAATLMPLIEGWHMARSCTCICTNLLSE